MKNILLIESDCSNSKYLQELLEDFGYKTVLAENGKEGIKIAKMTLPDIIICSVELPETDGFAVMAELGRNIETAGIPFILISSGKTTMPDFRYAMDSGADDYLIKPVRAGHLLKSIEMRLKKIDRILDKQDSLLKKNSTKNNTTKKLTYDDRLFLMVGSHPEILKISSIIFITAAEEYSNVYTTGSKHLLVQKLLKEWEKVLPSKVFLRIHRSTIINLDFVKKVEKWFNHSFRVYLEDVNEPFIISRRYSTRLRSLLNTSKW